MKIIDTHVHFELGCKPFLEMAKKIGINFSAMGLAESMKKNNIVHSVIIGFKDVGTGEFIVLDEQAKNPILPTLPEKFNLGVTPIAGINPYDVSLEKTEELLKNGKLKGLKFYLGYYNFAANDKTYYQFYELAKKYNAVVIFHTGDNYSKTAKVRFAQTLPIDDVAVDFPDLKIVMAHIGNPNIMDAAQVLYKNENVYADLSGMIVGGREKFVDNEAQKVKERIASCFSYVEDPSKFMFGSDWPLVNHEDYINLIKYAIPGEHHEDVFFNNAKRIFGL